MSKVLVTGASGFLGANLAGTLARNGYDVRVLVRASADLRGIAGVPCEIVYGDICNPDDVSAAVSGCEIVIHAACITDQWGISFEHYERVNFTATKYIVAACRKWQVRRLIYVSTANTLGPGSKARPGNELCGFTLFSANSGYINTKYLAQQYVLEQTAHGDLPAVVVNPTFMIGPNDSKPSSGKMILYGMSRRLLCYPPGGKNFVHVQDVCNGIVAAIDKGKTGECYLLAGDNLTYGEFFRILKQVSGSRQVLVRIPVWLLRLAGFLGSMTAKLTRRPVRLNNTSAGLLCLDNYYTGKKSERELQLRYTPVTQAVSGAIDWFRAHGYCR